MQPQTLKKKNNKVSGNNTSALIKEIKNSQKSSSFKNKTVAVIGLGYVGLPLAILIAKRGYKAIGVDTDMNKVNTLKSGKSPFEDRKISEDLKVVKLQVESKFEAIKEAGIVIVCVPTPVDHNSLPDLTPLVEASKGVSKYLTVDTLVIIESTVNPGICESVVLPILEHGSGLIAGKDFQLSHCPERINPGDEKWSIETIGRVVGSLTQKGLNRSLNFYSSILGKDKITPMGSIKEAEAVKIVENSFRDINIAFVNELAMSFSILGIDVVNVIKGASTKPFAFMAHYPGCGVGGHCIPVDPYYLIEHARNNGFEHKFLMTARQINKSMPKFTVKLFEESLDSKDLPRNKGKVAILGASYKANIDDIRESPSFSIYEELLDKGYEPIIYDPHVNHNYMVKDIDSALKNAVGVIIATAHKEFLGITPEVLGRHNVQILIDGRNCLDKKLFENSEITYKGIGR